MVLEDLKFIILNDLLDKFGVLNLEMTYDEFLEKYNLENIVTDGLVKDSVAFHNKVHIIKKKNVTILKPLPSKSNFLKFNFLVTKF